MSEEVHPANVLSDGTWYTLCHFVTAFFLKIKYKVFDVTVRLSSCYEMRQSSRSYGIPSVSNKDVGHVELVSRFTVLLAAVSGLSVADILIQTVSCPGASFRPSMLCCGFLITMFSLVGRKR